MRAWVYVLVSTSRYGGGAGGGGLRAQLGWARAGSAAWRILKIQFTHIQFRSAGDFIKYVKSSVYGV